MASLASAPSVWAVGRTGKLTSVRPPYITLEGSRVGQSENRLSSQVGDFDPQVPAHGPNQPRAQAGFVPEAHSAAASQALNLAEELASLHDSGYRTKLCEGQWGDKTYGKVVGASGFEPPS
jgi:hypothetical protein